VDKQSDPSFYCIPVLQTPDSKKAKPSGGDVTPADDKPDQQSPNKKPSQTRVEEELVMPGEYDANVCYGRMGFGLASES